MTLCSTMKTQCLILALLITGTPAPTLSSSAEAVAEGTFATAEKGPDYYKSRADAGDEMSEPERHLQNNRHNRESLLNRNTRIIINYNDFHLESFCMGVVDNELAQRRQTRRGI